MLQQYLVVYLTIKSTYIREVFGTEWLSVLGNEAERTIG